MKPSLILIRNSRHITFRPSVELRAFNQHYSIAYLDLTSLRIRAILFFVVSEEENRWHLRISNLLHKFRKLLTLSIARRITSNTSLIIEPSSAFLEEFTFSREHIDVFASETSRCENVIYPILRDVYKRYVGCFSLWSHKSIAYDAQLSGAPDYLISTKSALGKTVLGTPIIVVVEAKRNDFVEGWGQCLAELVAIQKINDDDIKPVYGIVTDGELWQFGRFSREICLHATRQHFPSAS